MDMNKQNEPQTQKKKHRWKQTNTSYMLHASIQCTCKNKCSMGVFLLEKTNIYTLSQSSFQSQTYHPPPCAPPISQIHNWATIMPEFICMVPAEVFTRCLWVLLTWLGCRSANLLGWSSGYSSIICWIWEMLLNWGFHLKTMFVIETVFCARRLWTLPATPCSPCMMYCHQPYHKYDGSLYIYHG